MTDLVKNIRSKLDPQELAYLKDTFGVELRDPETVAVLAELNAAARDVPREPRENSDSLFRVDNPCGLDSLVSDLSHDLEQSFPSSADEIASQQRFQRHQSDIQACCQLPLL